MSGIILKKYDGTFPFNSPYQPKVKVIDFHKMGDAAEDRPVVLLGAIAHSLFWINSSDGSIWSVLSLIGRTTGFILVAKGFFMLQPNQAAVVTLFGAFRGTDRSEGLRWVWPWMGKTKMSVRSNKISCTSFTFRTFFIRQMNRRLGISLP